MLVGRQLSARIALSYSFDNGANSFWTDKWQWQDVHLHYTNTSVTCPIQDGYLASISL